MLSQEDKIYLEGKFANFATKEDLKNFATKDDLKGSATKDDLKGIRLELTKFATKEDLKGFATKEDLKNFATKDDLNGFATKDDLKGFATNEKLEHETDFLAREIYKVYDTIDEFKAEFREFKNYYYTGQDLVVKKLDHIITEIAAINLNYKTQQVQIETLIAAKQ